MKDQVGRPRCSHLMNHRGSRWASWRSNSSMSLASVLPPPLTVLMLATSWAVSKGPSGSCSLKHASSTSGDMRVFWSAWMNSFISGVRSVVRVEYATTWPDIGGWLWLRSIDVTPHTPIDFLKRTFNCVGGETSVPTIHESCRDTTGEEGMRSSAAVRVCVCGGGGGGGGGSLKRAFLIAGQCVLPPLAPAIGRWEAIVAL